MMDETAAATTLEGFWRCAECGTPNPVRPYLTSCLGCGAEAAQDRQAEVPRAAKTRRSGVWAGLIGVFSWFYAVLILLMLALIHWVGEGWWGVTVLLFMPHWVFLGPIGVLALASALARRPRQWLVQAVAAILVAGPLMGLSLPVQQLWTRPVEGHRFRILTYNACNGDLHAEGLIDLIERQRIDFVSFQEEWAKHPRLAAFFARGWYLDRTRFVASRYPIVGELEPLIHSSTTEDRYGARMSWIRVRPPGSPDLIVASVHMPTLRPGLQRFLHGDVAGLKLHIEWWREQLGTLASAVAAVDDTPILIGGDFNMPSDDSTMAALRSILQFGFEEAGWGYGYTRPTRYPWFRIDHILASHHWKFTACRVGPDFHSDHLPLVAEVVLPANSSRSPEASGH